MKPDFVVKSYQLGRKSNTKVAVLYLGSLANKDVLKGDERKSASIDYIQAPRFIRELIEGENS